MSCINRGPVAGPSFSVLVVVQKSRSLIRLPQSSVDRAGLWGWYDFILPREASVIETLAK